MYETCKNAQPADLFPPYVVKHSCNTQSIPGNFCLVWQKNLSPPGISPFIKQGLGKRLQKLEDPRRTDKGNIRHKLEDIIIGLCTIVCNREDVTDMEKFGKQREEWLGGFLELPHGIPSSDTFRRIFEGIAPEVLSECLYDWLGYHWDEGRVIAIDGKTIRGSKGESNKAYHVVNAFVAEYLIPKFD